MPDTSLRLPFEIDATVDPTLVTGRAGVPLGLELFRQLGVAQTGDRHVAVKQRQRGLPPSQLVESLVALWASGGDRGPDLTTLREDQALATLLGYPLPAATTGRDFLEAFHADDLPLWAEPDVILTDQFRDGHGPAGCGNVRVLEQALATRPQGVTQLRLRADSALSETAVLRWCEDHRVEYAISADLSAQLKAELRRLPETAWHLEREEPDATREWAEVPYVPSDGDHRKNRPCVRRYLAVRIRKRQGRLFADGRSVHYFARVTNRAGEGLALLQWHREKAGTIEHVQHVLKTELAAAALPSGKFGANAAWFRLNTLTYNLLSARKRLRLPGDLRTARPKRLRFLLLNTVGKVVSHARRTVLRLTGAAQHALFSRVRGRIAALAPA